MARIPASGVRRSCETHATSSRRELFALDKTTGKLLWSHNFVKEYNAPTGDRGYACSPLAYNNTVIVTVGGSNQAAAAFNQETGALVWKAGGSEPSPASPIVIDVDGQPQLVVFGGDRITGMNPATGETLWSHPHRTDWGLNISTPVWSAAHHLLFVSAAYSSGSRALELGQSGGKTTVSEKWFLNRMRVHIGTVIRVGDYVYGSSGDFGPAPLTAVDAKSGQVLWQDRTFSKANMVQVGDTVILLDEDGTLALVRLSRDGVKVLTQAQVLDQRAWTAPTIAGRRMYVRDRKNIMAFDLP
jgi:outer membrane protein assembly factor BamB